MQVILLERIGRLGQMGDIVKVRPGFARNFLLPLGKAMRATKENMKHFEKERAQLEANNLLNKQEAEAVAAKLNGQRFTRHPASRRYRPALRLCVHARRGRCGDRMAASPSTACRFFSTARSRISGFMRSASASTPRSRSRVRVNVARTEEEADRQAAGEDVTKVKDDYAADYAAEQAAIAAEALFEHETEAHEE